MASIDPSPPQAAPPRPGEPRSRGPIAFRRAFWTGALIATPALVTLWLTASLILWVDALVLPMLPRALDPQTQLGVALPGFGVLIVLLILTALGFLTANVLGLKVLDTAEALVARLPVVRAVYRTTQEILGTLITRGDASFQHVALIEFPRPGVWAIVFVTAHARGAAAGLFDEEMACVFLPTTPNPTTGYFLYVAERDLKPLDISVEEAMKLVISAGLVGPEQVSGRASEGARSLIGQLRRSFDGRRLFRSKPDDRRSA